MTLSAAKRRIRQLERCLDDVREIAVAESLHWIERGVPEPEHLRLIFNRLNRTHNPRP